MRTRLPCALAALSLPLAAQAGATTARLEGRVVDPLQQPVAGAIVTAELDGEPLARTQTDAQGTFVFGRLPRQIVTVRAATPTPDLGGAWVDLFGLDRGFVGVVTMPARKVRGTVRDAAGEPVAGAWVGAAPSDGIEWAHACCTTASDANGRYELTHVPMGKATVRAWAAGCDAFTAAIDGSDDVELDAAVRRDAEQVQRFSLLGASADQAAAATLHVQVLHGGLPFPLPKELRRPARGEDGAFEFAGWPDVDEVRAAMTVRGAAVTPMQHSIPGGAGSCGVRFRLGDADALLTGRLQSRDGLSVAGRTLVVQPIAAPIDNHSRLLATTGSDGTFTVQAPVERGEAFALRMCDDHAVVDTLHPIRAWTANERRPARAWHVATHAPATRHEIMIRPATGVRVLVTGADRAPVHGASVSLFFRRTPPGRVAGTPLEIAAHGAPIAFGTTDLDGRCAIAGLELVDGDDLACWAIAGAGFVEVPCAAGGGAIIDLPPTELQPGLRITGVCLDADGKPAAGARVVLAARRSQLPCSLRTAADRHGRFAVDGLLPGEYALLRLHGQGNWLQIRLAEPVTEVTLR